MPNKQQYLQRANIIIGLIILVFGFLAFRFFTIQISNHRQYLAAQIAQTYVKSEIPPEKGLILDRNGNVLALSRLVDSVYAVPGKIKDQTADIQQLARILGLDAAGLNREIADAAARNKMFIWVKRRIDDDTSAKLKALKLAGVGFRSEYKRFYPNATLAGQLIGFRGIDEQALGGVELLYNNHLKGVEGYQYIPRDARQHRYAPVELVDKPPEPGHNVYLTIDTIIQSIVEESLGDIAKQYKPAWAGGLAIDPATGEVLAMANYPFFDPNNPQKYSDEVKRNRIVTDVYEPGSVFKPFVVTAALENNVFKPSDTFFCENGKFKVGKRTITDHNPYGKLTLTEVVAKSSNIGMAKVGLALGAGNVYSYIKKFGFGRTSGLGIPGEQAGFITPQNKWTNYTLTSVPMGYEISVNTLQLVRAYSAFANGGYTVNSKLLAGITDRNGNPISDTALAALGQARSDVIFRPKTAQSIGMMLREVVLSGTGTPANLKNYTVAGKTGTSKQLNPDGRYTNQYRSLFIGYAPVDKPKVLVIVVVDNPKGAYYGGTVAAPAVGKIIDKTLRYMEIQPSNIAVTKTKERRSR